MKMWSWLMSWLRKVVGAKPAAQNSSQQTDAKNDVQVRFLRSTWMSYLNAKTLTPDGEDYVSPGLYQLVWMDKMNNFYALESGGKVFLIYPDSLENPALFRRVTPTLYLQI